jgi:NAD(P)-dependent dehydrogenase (short-subunit alcohol dehydrogenase family)
MSIDFKGRVAIVTGAGAGLGRCHALELAKRGAKVVVNDLGGSRDGVGSGDAAAVKVVNEIKAMGGEAVPNFDNVATVKGGENIVKTAVDAFGKVDILINNAGILRDKSFTKMDEESWDAVMNVHLKGAFCVTKPAFEIMRANNYGRIVMTTSGAGIFGNFGQANYAAAKCGVVGLTNVLKIEGAKYNIKTNILAPIAATRMTEDIMPPPLLEKLKPEFVTPVVIYMCSEQCQDSGTIINAGAGYFSKSAILTGPGAILTDGKTIPTCDDVAAAWAKITNMDKTKYFDQVNTLFGEFGKLLS